MAGNASEIESRTIRRVAWRLLPLIVIIYLVAYIDRTNVSFAATGGMTIATTHIPTATGTDQMRTTPQARTNSVMQVPIMAKYT